VWCLVGVCVGGGCVGVWCVCCVCGVCGGGVVCVWCVCVCVVCVCVWCLCVCETYVTDRYREIPCQLYDMVCTLFMYLYLLFPKMQSTNNVKFAILEAQPPLLVRNV